MITICKLIITPIILTAMTIESNKHCGGARRIARLRESSDPTPSTDSDGTRLSFSGSLATF